jgi:serine/threonine-protein kinase
MLGSFGAVYLVDWGIAARTAGPPDEYLVGTPACMPPEMVARERCDARTDVYLLGALLHELLTGEPRHQGATLEDVLRSALCSDPVSYGPAIPEELAALCNAATSRDREARPATAAAFRRAVSGYLEHQSSLDIAARAWERLARLDEAQASGPADERTIGAGLIECRLAFLEALRAWAQNERAREGLSRTLRSMFSRELSQQNIAAARAILADFPDPPADLRGLLSEAEASDEARRREAEEQALRRREQDAKVSVLPRTVALLGTIFLGTITLFAPVLGEISSGEPMLMRDVVLSDSVMVASIALALIFGRKYLLANTYNRNWWAMLSLSLLSGLANDLLIWRWGLSSTLSPQFGMVSAATLFTLGAVTFEPRVWPLAVASVLGVVAVAVAPGLTTPVMGVVLLTMLAVIFSSWREYSSRAASAGDKNLAPLAVEAPGRRNNHRIRPSK